MRTITGHFMIAYRPLSRRLDRCDRVIQKESGDPNGGNMCSFSGATCTSRVRHNAHYVPYAQIRFDLYDRQRVASLTLDCNGVFVIRAYRAKQTAGHLRVSHVIRIVTRTSPLTTRALKIKPCASRFDFRTCVYFHIYKVAIQTNSRSLVATIIT